MSLWVSKKDPNRGCFGSYSRNMEIVRKCGTCSYHKHCVKKTMKEKGTLHGEPEQIKKKLELPLKTIELPMDGAFKVIIKVPRTMPQMVVASIFKSIQQKPDARFLLLPEGVKVIVIKKDGEAQVFGATII